MRKVQSGGMELPEMIKSRVQLQMVVVGVMVGHVAALQAHAHMRRRALSAFTTLQSGLPVLRMT